MNRAEATKNKRETHDNKEIDGEKVPIEQRRAYIELNGKKKAPSTMDTTPCAKPLFQAFPLQNKSAGKYVLFTDYNTLTASLPSFAGDILLCKCKSV